ncbi:MAG: hypothetical protein ACK4NC_03125 [Candidatus Gracilibacteria bacterium]
MPQLPELSKTAKDFHNEYAESMLFLFHADMDYLAARCLILNSLIEPGLEIACQAIEKIIKALLYLETKQKTTLKGNDKHNPAKLRNELESVQNRYKISTVHNDLLDRLFPHYQSRYHDNADASTTKSSYELYEIDSLYKELRGYLSIPQELLNRTYLSALSPKYLSTLRHYELLKEDNHSF